MSNPAAEKMYHSREFVTGNVFTAAGIKFFEDFVPQGRRHFFIGIEKQDPFFACDVLCEILLADISEPAMFVNAVSVFTADFDSAIGAEAIDDHNFVAPPDAFQATSNVPLFISGGNAG